MVTVLVVVVGVGKRVEVSVVVSVVVVLEAMNGGITGRKRRAIDISGLTCCRG
jgi:hypothetical protein